MGSQIRPFRFCLVALLLHTYISCNESLRVKREDEPAPDSGDAAPPSEELKIVAPDEWIEQAIRVLNQVRIRHAVCPVVLDKKLCQAAQERANSIVETAVQEQLPGAGEILYITNTNSEDLPKPSEAIVAWYSDKKNYDFVTGQPKEPELDIDSFTQLVWKGSTKACITYAKSSTKDDAPSEDHTLAVVARFEPVGNVELEKASNVFPEGLVAAKPDSQKEASPTKVSSKKCRKAAIRVSKAWQENILRAHNMLRRLHGSDPLILNPDLSEISQAYANKMARTHEFEHNTECLREAKLGENLYFSSRTTLDKDPINGTHGTIAWYNEIENYDYTTTLSKNNMEITHFTQLIWKETKEMGAAYAISSKPNSQGFYSKYLVVNYLPRGNYDDFIVNVVPPTCQSVPLQQLGLPTIPETEAETGLSAADIPNPPPEPENGDADDDGKGESNGGSWGSTFFTGLAGFLIFCAIAFAIIVILCTITFHILLVIDSLVCRL